MNFRASVINFCRELIIVIWKKCFIGILNLKIFLFQKITYSKLPILDSQEPQVSQLKGTHIKLLHYGIVLQMCCWALKNIQVQLISGLWDAFLHKCPT